MCTHSIICLNTFIQIYLHFILKYVFLKEIMGAYRSEDSGLKVAAVGILRDLLVRHS